MKLSQRLSERARRCEDLSPLAAPVRDLVSQDNREAIMAGQDCDGHRVADLSPWTIATRKGTGPPRAPRGTSSRMVADLVVSVLSGVGRLSYTKSWPMDWVRFHMDGTRKMPRRDPSGVRPAARAAIHERLAAFVRGGK